MLWSLLKDKILRWPYVLTVPLLMAGLALASFFTGTDTYWFLPPLLAVFAYAGYVTAAGMRTGWDLPRGAVIYGVVAFAAYVMLSVLWADVPYISGLFAYILGSLPLLFLALICAPRAGESVRIHGTGAFVVLCALAAWAWVQFFFLFDTYGPRIHNPMLSPNSLAALFVLGLFMALGLFVQARGARSWGAFGLLLLFLMALLVTQSRGGAVFSLVALAVFLAVMWRHPGVRKPKMLALPAAMAFCYLIVNHGSNNRLDRNVNELMHAHESHSLLDRLALAKSTLRMLGDHFWTGVGGAGTFYFNYPAYRSPVDFSDGFFTHMDPLQYGAEMGILAPVLFYFVLCAVLWRTVVAIRRSAPDSRVRVEIMGSFCAMLAILIHTHMDFHLYILVTLIAMAFPLAWWYVATEEALSSARIHVNPPPGRPLLLRALTVALVLGLLVWPARAAVTTMMFPALQKAVNSNDMTAAQTEWERISAIAPQSYYRLHQYHGRILSQLLSDGRGTLPHAAARALYDQALAAFDTAVAYNPQYTGIRSDRAKLYLLSQGWLDDHGYDKAEAALEEIVDQNPLDWDARIGLVNLYQRRGYFSKALHVLERGRTWPMPKGPLSLKLLLMEADLHLKMGDREGQQAILRKARDFAISRKMVDPAKLPAPDGQRDSTTGGD